MASPQGQKKLFTPGPLSTTLTVKQAMLRDVFPRGEECSDITSDIMKRILNVAGAPPDQWSVILLQGTGSYGLEAVIHTVVPKTKDGRVLILHNGFYANRLIHMCEIADIQHDTIKFGETKPYNLAQIEKQLSSYKYSLVVAVHCETSVGLINPVEAVAKMVRTKQPNAAFLIDAMSSFSAIPLTFDDVDFVVTSPNKVMQGVPGFAFILTRTKRLEGYKGNARTLAFDLIPQHKYLQDEAQFRFTPPTHVLLAAQQALKEYEVEGGPTVRRKRYQNNANTLWIGARCLGFKTVLPEEQLSPIATAFLYPKHPKFTLKEFTARLNALGVVVFPEKLTDIDSFRVGTMGDIQPTDIEKLLKNMELVLKDMGVPVPVP